MQNHDRMVSSHAASPETDAQRTPPSRRIDPAVVERSTPKLIRVLARVLRGKRRALGVIECGLLS